MARLFGAALLSVAIGALFVAGVEPQGPRAQSLPPADGARLFRSYCAACHGTAGRGDGPMATHLRKVPPNLATLAKRNGGVFPAERVRQVIEGAGPAAHGSRDMPVWGPLLERLSMGGTSAEDRIDALVRHLQDLQERPAE